MRDNGIRYVTTGGPSKKSREVAREFRTDEDIQVFLLHSERESAGLTLTCARYVFLGPSLPFALAPRLRPHLTVIESTALSYAVEPTLSPSFELQAIGRVDRLGQTQQTTVFCYASNQTVDANIVRLSGTSGPWRGSAKTQADLYVLRLLQSLRGPRSTSRRLRARPSR
jgi:E3 ubiquitin-protein ligase SHPRH